MTHLDHDATSHSGSGVLEAMMPTLEETFGNPSGNRRSGMADAGQAENARRKVADAVGMDATDAASTSVATETGNLELAGLRAGLGTRGKQVKFQHGCGDTHTVVPLPCSRSAPSIGNRRPSVPFRPIITSRLPIREVLARESIGYAKQR